MNSLGWRWCNLRQESELWFFPTGGGFIVKLNPPCTLQNCRGMLLLLNLIDMTDNLWPWMSLDDEMDGWMDGSDDEWKKLHNHTSRPRHPLHIVMTLWHPKIKLKGNVRYVNCGTQNVPSSIKCDLKVIFIKACFFSTYEISDATCTHMYTRE